MLLSGKPPDGFCAAHLNMNDARIRESFHRKRLNKHHADRNTLIIDELGLKHGKCRADIAVINKYLIGYEIKSNADSLCRLDQQIATYSRVFDHASIVVGTKHIDRVRTRVPEWWGIIATYQGHRGEVSFETIRASRMNKDIDPLSIAQLLWSNEAIEILSDFGVPAKVLQRKRLFLYQQLVELLSPAELRRRVRNCLRNRRNWRCLGQPSANGDLSQPSAR